MGLMDDPHDFPAPHNDSVESFLECSVPTDKVSQIVEFDGSVVVNRTRGELSARCHDEEANHLALNLTNDIITEQRPCSRPGSTTPKSS
jgi:hypothetical protein